MSDPTSRRIPAPLLILIAIASVQTGSAVAKTVFGDISPNGVAFARLLIAAIVMVLIFRPRVSNWGAAEWSAVVALGLGMAGMNALIYLSFEHLSLGVAVTLEYVGPLAVALVQARRRGDLLWAVLAGLGVLILGVLAGGHLSMTGVLLALGSGAFWAFYILASARVGQRVSGTGGLAVAMVVAALAVAPFGAGDAFESVGSQPVLLLQLALVAVLSSILPYSLELAALRRVTTNVFGVMSSLNPAAAALTGLLIVGETIGWLEAIALLCVSFASAGVALKRA